MDVRAALQGGKKKSELPSDQAIIAAAVNYFKTVRNKFNHGAKGVLDQQREDASFRTKLLTVSHATRRRGARHTQSDRVVYFCSFFCLFV